MQPSSIWPLLKHRLPVWVLNSELLVFQVTDFLSSEFVPFPCVMSARFMPQILKSEGGWTVLCFVRHPQLRDGVPVFPAAVVEFRDLHSVWGKVALNSPCLWTQLAFVPSTACFLLLFCLYENTKCEVSLFPFRLLQFSDGQKAARLLKCSWGARADKKSWR